MTNKYLEKIAEERSLQPGDRSEKKRIGPMHAAAGTLGATIGGYIVGGVGGHLLAAGGAAQHGPHIERVMRAGGGKAGRRYGAISAALSEAAHIRRNNEDVDKR